MSGCWARIVTAARSPSSVCVGGHADVGDDDVGLVVGGVDEESVGVADSGDDLVTDPFQDADEALAQEHDILGDHDPQWSAIGHVILTWVGPPGGLVMSRVPSMASMRAARPASPVPRAGSAPPWPSSTTVTVKVASATQAWICAV